MMNMNKNRKNNTSRTSGGPGGPGNANRSSPRSRAPAAEGVYSNSHFLHAAASQMGNNVRVQTKGGVVVEGIFRTFSEDFSIALEVPHRYQNGGDDKKINVETVQDNLIIKLCDIVTIQAKDVDLDYAVRDTFQTDTAISSRMNGSSRPSNKELVKWDGAENGDLGIGLELDTQTNGWDANEMFQLNEKEHGIRTTFKDNLESYTVQIDKKDTQDFRKAELEAERIANEIENNPMTRDRLDLENGDEEAAFAAVIRPEEANDKMTTPPPATAPSQKYIPQQQPPPKRNPDRKMIPANNNNNNNKPMYPKPMQQPVVQQTINATAAGFKTMTINPPPQYTHQPPPTHYPGQMQEGKVNGDREGKAMPPRQMRMMNPIPVSFNEPPPPLNPANQHMGKPPAMGIHMPPPPHLQNAPEGQQTIHVVTAPVLPTSAVVVTHAPPPPIHMHQAPQPQRPPREPMMRGRNEEIRQLQNFHSNFQMATSAPPPGQQQNVPPQVPNSQPPPQRPEMQDNGQNPMSHPPPNANEMGKAGNSNHQQQHMHHPTPSSTPHAEKTHGPSLTPPQATTPQSVNTVNTSSNSGSSGGGNANPSETTPPANIVEKSTLNPKAKPFTLNPQAKPFTPRSPSTPNQSRPHTPQTPGPMAQQQQQQQQIPQPQQAVYPQNQLIFYCVPQQRPTPPPAMTVRNNKFQQFHVSQATGQPIFNPQVPQQVMQAFHPPHQMQTVPPQTYPSTAIRMYQHEAQPQSHITSYLVPTPPSTTPSPGQAHQPTFHPGPQPSPAAGGPAQGFPGGGQYVMIMPSYPPQFVNSNQHNPQQPLQVMMPQQQQHPAQ